MSDYIKREDAIKAVHEEWDGRLNYDGSGQEIASDTEDALYVLPSADVEPVRRGKWEREEEYGDLWICNQCGFAGEYKDNYCPNCGAKMEGDENETD